MALRLLDGPPIDIHAGGIDLIFPHHENEIAQAEGATNETFSRFWMHVEHLFVENEKMSKSLGNVYDVPDILARGHRAVVAALPAAVVALPEAAELHLGRDGPGRGVAPPDRRLPRRGSRRGGRTGGGPSSAPPADRDAGRRLPRGTPSHRRSSGRPEHRGGAGGDLRPDPRRQRGDRRETGERRGRGDRSRGVRAVRPRARRHQPAAARRRAAAGAGRGDRAADRRPRRPRASGAISPPPTRSARRSPTAASCSRTTPPEHAGSGNDRPDAEDRSPGSEGAGDHRARREGRLALLHAATTRSSSPGARGHSSRTWTATSFSTAPPASP